MKLLCISAPSEDADQAVVGATQQPNKLRAWYNSLRRGMKRTKEPRVTISEPIQIQPLTQSELIQINGVIEVKPCLDDNGQVPNSRLNNNGAEATDELDKPALNEGTGTTEAAETAKEHLTTTTTEAIEATHVEIEGYNKEAEEEETSEKIVSYVWFWGSISRKEAESLLRGKKDGSFLVRESSDKRFLYSLSFRSNGKTMHTRIEQSNGLFFFYSNEANYSNRGADGSRTLYGLISVAMNQNNASDSIFFYSRGLRSETSLHTVSLNQPLSRYQYLLDYEYQANENKALQYMCKFVSHHCPTGRSKLESQLQTLPAEIRTFAENSFYFPRRSITAN